MIAPIALALALSAGPPTVSDDSHELILLHPTRAYRVRLHIRIHGQPFATPWSRQVAGLYRHLDANRDDRLSAKEFTLAPSREQWLQMSAGDSTIDPDAAPPFAEVARGKDHVTFADLTAYYSRSAAGPLRMGYGAINTARSYSGPIWDALRPRSTPESALRVADLRRAPKLLERLDANEDEMLGGLEILGISDRGDGVAPVATRGGPAHGQALYGMPIFSRSADGRKGTLEKALAAAYPKRKARLGPVDAVLRFDLGRDHSPRLVGTPTRGLRVRPMRGGLILSVGDWVFHVRLEPPSTGTASRRQDASKVFVKLDRNSNGYFDNGELQQPPFRFISWERLADANHDGMVTKSEFVAFAEMLDSLTCLRASVDVTDHKRSLFHFIDSDGDGKLSRRELTEAWKTLPERKGGYKKADLPHVFRMVVRAGRAQLMDQGPPKPYVPPERGPIWFRRMDRNRDGDVSLTEWLGRRAEFARIDRDNDSLISPEEAEAYDRATRAAGKR